MNCPKDIEVSVSPGTKTTQVSWTVPTVTYDTTIVFTATDDHTTPPGQPQLVASHFSPSPLNVGVTEVSYMWRDNDGNTAECKFNISVHGTFIVQGPRFC